MSWSSLHNSGYATSRKDVAVAVVVLQHGPPLLPQRRKCGLGELVHDLEGPDTADRRRVDEVAADGQQLVGDKHHLIGARVHDLGGNQVSCRAGDRRRSELKSSGYQPDHGVLGAHGVVGLGPEEGRPRGRDRLRGAQRNSQKPASQHQIRDLIVGCE